MRKILHLCLLFIVNLQYTVLGDCDKPLVGSKDVVVRATSTLSSERAPNKARLNGRIAWTAGNSDFGQYFSVNLNYPRNVTYIATQGRPYTSEFVQEYRIEYGNNDVDYAEYKDSEGNTKLFVGNRDGNAVQVNRFDPPIIAQWIRINPTRWRDRISLRVELYGCDYVSEVLGFDGQSFVRKDLQNEPVMSHRDWVRLRFKTNMPDGILIYSRGTQGDYFALQVVENKLLLNIDLGAKQNTKVSVGSLLDDNLWHDVIIYRNEQDVVFTVDRVVVKKKIHGDFSQLDLNQEILIGGVPNFNVDGLVVTRNFSGCIENLIVNYTNIIANIKNRNDLSLSNVGVLGACMDENVMPVTFRDAKSNIVFKSHEGLGSLNVSLDFRTFNEEGLILYHRFSIDGSLKLYLNMGRIKLDLSLANVPRIVLDGFDKVFNDGSWHKVILVVAENFIELNVDRKPSRTKRVIKMVTGTEFRVGGGVLGTAGFVGCMRYISIDGSIVTQKQHIGDIILDSCQTTDRCNPNPCEHGGKCRQNAEEFFCNCGDSGYGGAVCHTSLRPLSCEAFKQNNPDLRHVSKLRIDIDGSGPLPAFPVDCDVTADRANTTTTLRHRNEATTTVNGFEKPGSFMQEIIYDANFEQMTELVNRSRTCKQNILYECFQSRLLNTRVRDPRPFEPFSWWVSRNNQPMDYWGGSLPGTRTCQCGQLGTCIEPGIWCNCDSGRNGWLSDGGEITQKEFLPVKQLRFGDTGSPLDRKQGRYTLGALICEGDSIYQHEVTFRLPDATLNYPTFDMGHSGDIYFEFKTTIENAVLVHSKGPVDFIKISLVAGDQIQFTYYAGHGPLGVSVETSIKLNDNNWHTVLVERNRKEAEVVVDGSLRNKIVEPIGSSRAIHLTSNLVIGASVDLRDGFVGCMRALMLNGRPMDMHTFAEQGQYGVLPGCVGKCDSSPCLNNGTCLERYSRYNCDCRWTSFKGTICADEIGVNLRRDDMVEYEFEGTYKSTTAEKIRVGFVTSEPQGLLVGVMGQSGEYFSLVMANSGHLKIVFDFGFERQEVITNNTFANGQNHDVWVTRKNGGRTMVIKADNYAAEEFTFKIDKTQDVQFDNLRTLHIGKNRTMKKGEGFIGCVSRVEFDDVYVLKLLFQEERPPNIRPYPESLREDFCGIEAVTYPPELTETRPPPSYDPRILVENRGYTRADSAVLGGILAIIFIALIAMAILIGRYVSRHKGEYKTHEDKGALDAPDADTAIVHGQTGHSVSKKKEIFI